MAPSKGMLSWSIVNTEILSGGDLENLRPLDCQGLHSSHGRGNQRLPSMQIGLSTHNLLKHCHLLGIQVLQKNSFLQIFSRLCDSRNLNLSPFCTLSASTLAKWQPDIKSTYGKTMTNYTSKLPGPLRMKYPSTPEKELLASLTQVLIQNALFIKNDPIQGEAYYNVYEKDIAVVNIFFGGSTVFGEEMSYQI